MKGLYNKFYKGNLSELLADYLLSNIGVATPVRRQFDHGIDFYCNLMSDESDYLTFGYPFAIQVKSISESEIHYGETKPNKWRVENIKGLFRNEILFFIGFVDKENFSIQIHDTTGLWQLYLKDQKEFSQITLRPGNRQKTEWRENVKESSLPGDWDKISADGFQHVVDMGNPIIDINEQDIHDKEILQKKKNILRAILTIEQTNIIHRNLGINCFQEIKANAKNDPYCQWGMNVRADFKQEYIPRLYESMRLALISLSNNLQFQGRNEETIAVKNLLKHIPKADYYQQLYTGKPEYFDWMKEHF